MNTAPAIEIRNAGRGFAVHAGASRLSRAFRTRCAAETWAESNARFLAYWAGSASVSADNTEPRVIHA